MTWMTNWRVKSLKRKVVSQKVWLDRVREELDLYKGIIRRSAEVVVALERWQAVVVAGAAAFAAEKREMLAEHMHSRWANWMDRVFSLSEEQEDGSVLIPKDWVERWRRQMETSYKKLPDDEKASDLLEADWIFNKLFVWLPSPVAELITDGDEEEKADAPKDPQDVPDPGSDDPR